MSSISGEHMHGRRLSDIPLTTLMHHKEKYVSSLDKIYAVTEKFKLFVRFMHLNFLALVTTILGEH